MARSSLPSRGRSIHAGGALLAAALLVICASGLPLQATQLTSAEASFEGRLARLVLGLEGGDGTVTLSRQGPPDRRDLVIEIPGATAAPGLPGHSASDALLPWAISSSPGGSPALRIVLEGLGDSLVKMESVPASLSLLLIPPEPGAVELTGSYRVGSDDVLAVSVFGHEDLTKTSKVGPDGQIKLPLIGNVRAAGRTVDAIADEIEERLGEEFLVDPHVTVSVWEYLSQWVNVMGEVNKPGRYYMTGQTTLVDAVSMAGGLKPSAGDTILVTRRPMESEPEAAGQIIRFSASAMMGNEQDAAGFTLRPGDVVNVAVGEFVYLEGEVRSPGAYALSRDTTLLGAVGMAGGFAPGVEDAVLDLIRDDGGRRERTSYSSRELKEGSDPVVRPGDVVVVRRRS